MPRQDVPYGGAICRLKERIAEIWDKLGEKLHSINGVEGDAAGDVKIVSADPAVVITNNAASHEIEIGLDSLELPSAAVTSVNGETGAVTLGAADIPSDGGSDVQTDIDVNKAAISACSSAITSEQLARQNADATLQGNINAVQASIPGAAATAVANDPTVAQLATDVPNKLDKITSGSSLKAYTHTGANQGETSISSGTDANSIGLRNANGRMYGADPASGATDRSLVTANWVSQTGDAGPNNLIHRSGNETKNGNLTINIGVLSTNVYPVRSVTNEEEASTVTWHKVYSWPVSNVVRGISFTIFSRNDGRTAYYTATGNTSNGSIHNDGVWNGIDSDLKLAYDRVGVITLFSNTARKDFSILQSGISNNTGALAITLEDMTIANTEPVAGPDYAWVVGVSA